MCFAVFRSAFRLVRNFDIKGPNRIDTSGFGSLIMFLLCSRGGRSHPQPVQLRHMAGIVIEAALVRFPLRSLPQKKIR